MTTPTNTTNTNSADDPNDLPLASSAALVDLFVQEAQAHGLTVGQDVRASLNNRILAQDKAISAEPIAFTPREHWYRIPRVMKQLAEITQKHLAVRLTSSHPELNDLDTETLTTITVDDLTKGWDHRVTQRIPTNPNKRPAPGMTWIPR